MMWIMIITLLTHGGMGGGYWGVVTQVDFISESTCKAAAVDYYKQNHVRYGPDFITVVCVKK